MAGWVDGGVHTNAASQWHVCSIESIEPKALQPNASETARQASGLVSTTATSSAMSLFEMACKCVCAIPPAPISANRNGCLELELMIWVAFQKISHVGRCYTKHLGTQLQQRTHTVADRFPDVVNVSSLVAFRPWKHQNSSESFERSREEFRGVIQRFGCSQIEREAA